MTEQLRGKRVLLLGAATEMGRALAVALAEAGADVASIAATNDAEAAFAVQRLSRRLATHGGRYPAQAIDATNEMAVRVMVRQVSKQLGGLDAIVFCTGLGATTATSLQRALRLGAKEMIRTGGGQFVVVGEAPSELAALPEGVELAFVGTKGSPLDQISSQVIGAVAGGPHNG